MQKCKVLGIKEVDFTDEKSGERVTGRQLWVSSETRDPAWNGQEVIKIWCKTGSDMHAQCDQLDNGDEILVEFNRRGKAIAFDLA